MPHSVQDFQLVIASVNGSGTLTSNRVLHKVLFREGFNVVGKNLFPSNIEGLPTYYFLRISKSGQSLKTQNEIYVSLNPATYDRDLKTLVNTNTLVFSNADLKLQPPPDLERHDLSFRQTVKDSSASIKIKKRMSNMSYVGWLGRYLNLDLQIIKDVIASQFSSEAIIDENINVMLAGWNSYTGDGIHLDKSLKQDNSKKILIEGNQAAALGWVNGGCTVATWYPITPSTSLVESFETYAKALRPNENSVAIVQSEDEISAVASVVGAGWAGARAATATSGPGLSLMSEALGLAYFAEIPAVVCDVQRVGPSTGLPTRTSQGDLEYAYKISHGDTFHPVLLPATPEDCFAMSAQAFDLADKYQTPVLVLSDLDLGMNLWTSETLQTDTNEFDRSTILTEPDLEKLESQGQSFKRYLGDDKGIPSRTLPGTHHPKASYFTRGSGHNESAGYSEHPEDFEKLMLRLQSKIMNARLDLPKPIIQKTTCKMGAIFYGTTQQIFPEVSELLGLPISTCQVQSLPLHQEVLDFINSHDQVFVIEQNRDGQLRNIILQSGQILKPLCLQSVLHFDGWSVQADVIATKIKQNLENSHPSISASEGL